MTGIIDFLQIILFFKFFVGFLKLPVDQINLFVWIILKNFGEIIRKFNIAAVEI